jgi:hypothetical protein
VGQASTSVQIVIVVVVLVVVMIVSRRSMFRAGVRVNRFGPPNFDSARRFTFGLRVCRHRDGASHRDRPSDWLRVGHG